MEQWKNDGLNDFIDFQLTYVDYAFVFWWLGSSHRVPLCDIYSIRLITQYVSYAHHTVSEKNKSKNYNR